MKRPPWLIQLRIWYFTRRARRAMSPAAWAAHRKAMEDAARYEDSREIERQCEAVRGLVARLEIAASVGSREARQRITRLALNPVGTAAAKAASEALARLDKQLRGSKK